MNKIAYYNSRTLLLQFLVYLAQNSDMRVYNRALFFGLCTKSKPTSSMSLLH